MQTIAKTGRSQFLLQRTVEGLSTIAISYYTIGLLGYVLATPLEMFAIDKTLVLSVARAPRPAGRVADGPRRAQTPFLGVGAAAEILPGLRRCFIA